MDDTKAWPTAAVPVPVPVPVPVRGHHRRHRDRSTKPQRRGGDTPPPAPSTSFADLPFDVLARVAAAFDVPDLWAASTVCRSWREALRPLREAMVLLRWGKRFKHGHGGDGGGGGGKVVRPDLRKALDSFLKGAARGSAAAMVDAGLMYWEMGKKEEAVALYKRAAGLGHPAGQCNLGICYLETNHPGPEEAVKWFYRAAESGYARAQYNLALCLQRGRGVNCNVSDAAKWYLRAAEGGHVRAMYNISLCYSMGEGLPQNLRRAKTWMKHAADCGHKKAQFEHGLELFSSGDMMKALVYLELATRAGETAASRVRNVILQSLSQTSRDRAMLSADKWRPLRFHPSS